MNDVQFGALVGETLVKVTGAEINSDRITFETASGKAFALYHDRDCCESVDVNEIVGSIDDLIGAPITMAEEVESDKGDPQPPFHDSWTWTFYKLATIKGYVTIRWLGQSNGYYSERVTFAEVTE